MNSLVTTYPGAWRFVRYTSVGVSTFTLDLVMLYAGTHIFGVPYLFMTPAAFLIAVSINYALSRKIAFSETTRPWRDGYVYFIIAALCGAFITTVLVSNLITLFGLHLLVARILTSFVVGIGNYLFNLFFNFKVAGVHH